MRNWLAPLLTAGFVMAGFFKAVDALSFLTFDVTFALAAATAAVVVARLVTVPIPQTVHGVLLGFMLLIPAAFFVAPTVYGVEKVTRLLTVTFLAMLAPIVLIRDRHDARRHLFALTGFCGIVVAGGLFNPQLSSDYEGAPITTESVDTIAIALAAAVVVVVMTMGLIWRRIPWWLAAPVGAGALYVLLQSGSRGPLFSATLAILAGVLLTRVRPNPFRGSLFVVLAGLGAVIAFNAAPIYSQQRIAGLLGGSDTSGTVGTRAQLFESALDSIARQPLGTGWGGFQKVTFSGYSYPHDLPLEVLAEAGLLFGGLFLVWLVLNVGRAQRMSVDFVGGTVFVVLLCVLGKALVSGDINDNRVVFYALGIALALGAAARVQRSDELPAASAPDARGASRTAAAPLVQS